MQVCKERTMCCLPFRQLIADIQLDPDCVDARGLKPAVLQEPDLHGMPAAKCLGDGRVCIVYI